MCGSTHGPKKLMSSTQSSDKGSPFHLPGISIVRAACVVHCACRLGLMARPLCQTRAT
jgi:hypothetical protein